MITTVPTTRPTGSPRGFRSISSRSGYDPFYAQQHWQHRRDDQWNRQVQADFTHRRDHEEARPARTFAAQQQQLGRNDRPEQNVKSVIAQQLDQFRKTKENSIRFQQVDNDRPPAIRPACVKKSRRSANSGSSWRPKLSTRPPLRSVQGGPSARVKLPKSPFVAKRPDEFDENQRPPQTHAQPQLDPKLVPQPRRQRSPRAGTSPETPKVSVEPKAAPKVEPKPAATRSTEDRQRQQHRKTNRRTNRRTSPNVNRRKHPKAKEVQVSELIVLTRANEEGVE